MTGVPAPWREMALVCRKCSRKLHGGFGRKGKESLPDVLREALKAAGHRRAVRVVEVECLKLCPKKAVTVALTSQPGTVFVVPQGGDVAELLAKCGT